MDPNFTADVVNGGTQIFVKGPGVSASASLYGDLSYERASSAFVQGDKLVVELQQREDRGLRNAAERLDAVRPVPVASDVFKKRQSTTPEPDGEVNDQLVGCNLSATDGRARKNPSRHDVERLVAETRAGREEFVTLTRGDSFVQAARIATRDMWQVQRSVPSRPGAPEQLELASDADVIGAFVRWARSEGDGESWLPNPTWPDPEIWPGTGVPVSSDGHLSPFRPVLALPPTVEDGSGFVMPHFIAVNPDTGQPLGRDAQKAAAHPAFQRETWDREIPEGSVAERLLTGTLGQLFPKVEHIPGRAWSYDWCRFRHDQRCCYTGSSR